VTNPRVCLSMSSGRFRLSWAGTNIADTDFVALYASTTAPDSDYIGGAWEYASRATFFDTAIPGNPGFQGRYLVWSATSGKYVSVVRTGGFPSFVASSIAVSYPRRPTSSEWSSLVGSSPSLQQSSVWVTGPTTPTYNCIAW